MDELHWSDGGPPPPPDPQHIDLGWLAMIASTRSVERPDFVLPWNEDED